MQAENVQADAENEFLAWGENHEFQLEDFVLLRLNFFLSRMLKKKAFEILYQVFVFIFTKLFTE